MHDLFTKRIGLVKPTLIVDRAKTEEKIRWMLEKASKSKVRFRPHFKTHQSAEIGDWFRKAGCTAITVSSFDMAAYFAQHGWDNITIALPVNINLMREMSALAKRIRLGLLVESVEAVDALAEELTSEVDIWIKIDHGYHRTGVLSESGDRILEIVQAVQAASNLRIKGILTHSGHTYAAKSRDEIAAVFNDGVQKMKSVQAMVEKKTGVRIEISMGDTPGCTVVEDFSEIDEIRPGCFVFYDMMHADQGVCDEDQVSIALAAPILAKHEERNEIIVHGGAVHLSKDALSLPGGGVSFGAVALPEKSGWSKSIEGTRVASISQEHGIIRTKNEAFFSQAKIGDFLMMLPVHSCLTANLMGRYMTITGERLGSAVEKNVPDF